jgi:hypothetical protein
MHDVGRWPSPPILWGHDLAAIFCRSISPLESAASCRTQLPTLGPNVTTASAPTPTPKEQVPSNCSIRLTSPRKHDTRSTLSLRGERLRIWNANVLSPTCGRVFDFSLPSPECSSHARLCCILFYGPTTFLAASVWR